MIVFIINCIYARTLSIKKDCCVFVFNGCAGIDEWHVLIGTTGMYEYARSRQLARIRERSEELRALEWSRREEVAARREELCAYEWLRREEVAARRVRRELNATYVELERWSTRTHGSSRRLPSVATTPDQVSKLPPHRPATPEQETRLEDIWRKKQPCVICLEAYSSKTDIKLTTCNHHMHSQCKDELVKSGPYVTEPKCPVCRQPHPFEYRGTRRQ